MLLRVPIFIFAIQVLVFCGINAADDSDNEGNEIQPRKSYLTGTSDGFTMECGRTPMMEETQRMKLGFSSDAEPGMFPYIVGLYNEKFDDRGESICGIGLILDSYTVLASIGAIERCSCGCQKWVKYGDFDMDHFDSSRMVQFSTIARNDTFGVALVFTTHPIVMGPIVQPICLSENTNLVPGDIGTVLDFGSYKKNISAYHGNLKVTSAPVVSRIDVQDWLDQVGISSYVEEDPIYVGWPTNDHAYTSGAGVPMVRCENGRSSLVAFGKSSYGSKAKQPQLYKRLSEEARDWIIENMGAPYFVFE